MVSYHGLFWKAWVSRTSVDWTAESPQCYSDFEKWTHGGRKMGTRVKWSPSGRGKAKIRASAKCGLFCEREKHILVHRSKCLGIVTFCEVLSWNTFLLDFGKINSLCTILIFPCLRRNFCYLKNLVKSDTFTLSCLKAQYKEMIKWQKVWWVHSHPCWRQWVWKKQRTCLSSLLSPEESDIYRAVKWHFAYTTR